MLSNSISKEACGSDGHSEKESDSICSQIQSFWKKKIIGTDKALFQTVTTQKSFLRCYNGLQEGALFPLRCGIVFVKPLVFIPNEEIASLTAGRGGGSGNTRYVDLKVQRPSAP